jgi:hypothetical protein
VADIAKTNSPFFEYENRIHLTLAKIFEAIDL